MSFSAQVVIPAPGGYYTDASKKTFVAAPEAPKKYDPANPDTWPSFLSWAKDYPSVYKTLPELAPGADDKIELKVGDTLETSFSLRLVIPEEELGEAIDDIGTAKDVFKPRTFDEWIRSRFTVDAIERVLNQELAKKYGTTRVAVDVAEVLSTRPVASERPELRGTGVGIQRAEVRVRIRVTHNAFPLVLVVITALLAATAAALWAGRDVIDSVTEAGPRLIRRLGEELPRAAGGLLPLVLVLALAAVLLK